MAHSEEALGLVIGLETAHAVWEALKDAYAQDSQEREFTLRQQLTYLRKEDDKTIGDHIRIFKGLCDNLAAIGKNISDKEKVFCLLTSLGPQYETFTTTMLKPPHTLNWFHNFKVLINVAVGFLITPMHQSLNSLLISHSMVTNKNNL